MVFEELLNGHELILRHTNSVKELPSKGFKEYCPNNSWLEQKQIENQLEEKLNFIKAERIEKSNCLSQAEWIHELKKAKVTKKVGKLWETLGHHHDNEDWLLPEEALFLLENCELQLFCDSICISIEDCYRLIFQESDCSLDEYRVFSYLSRAGFRVVRHSPSVTATRYERQVKLDTVIQMQRRSPPRTSAEESVTVIDDDISIVEKSEDEEKNNENQTSKGTEKKDQVEVIEIDDEPVEKDVVHEIDSDSDSDSDIVCISSPSHVPDKNVRNWYPILQKCLRRPMEALIDLCDDENSPDDNKQLVESKLDLLRVPKREILSLVPSAKNGVSFISVPDSRLLPPNIVPRYSEYKVNLNIRSDTTNQNYMYRDQGLFNGGMHFNNVGMQFDMSNNPLLQKAEEMQLAAMSMIQTAAALMSVANSANQRPLEPWSMSGNNIRAIANQNPNELWSMFSNRGTEIAPFNQFPQVAQLRPRFWNPRRGRFPRRRFFGDRQTHRSPRKPYRFDNPRYHSSDNESSNVSGVRMIEGSSSPSTVVILSDDDESDAKNRHNEESQPEIVKKRKQSCEIDLNKRLKTETDTDIASESSSCILEDVIRKETDIVLKKESGEDFVKIESEIKSKYSSKIKTESHDKKLVLEDAVKTEVVKPLNGVSQPTVKNERESNCVENKNIVTKTERSELQSDKLTNNAEVDNLPEKHPKDKNSPSLNTQGENSSTSNMNADTPQENLNESSSNNKMQQAQVYPSENSSSSIGNVSTQEMVIDKNKSNEEITTWEQYKNKPDDFDEIDSLIKFDQCSTYGHVLSALQIFKQIEVNRVNKKFKVSFDVYLPDSNFKKTLKVLPNYRVIVLKSNEELPSTTEIESLKIEYQDSIPFLFSIVFDETIAFYLYNSVSINTFCD